MPASSRSCRDSSRLAYDRRAARGERGSVRGVPPGEFSLRLCSTSRDGLGSGGDPELAVDRPRMRLHSVHRQVELAPDLAEAQVAGEPTHDPPLGGTQLLGRADVTTRKPKHSYRL